MLLYQQDHTWLMQGMEKGGATTSNIEGGEKVWSDPSQPSGWEPDRRAVWGRRANNRGRQTRRAVLWRVAGQNGGWAGRGFLSPHIIMPNRGGGVPKVALCAGADRMDSEGTMDMEGDLVHGRSGSYLQSTAPLGPIAGLLTELLE